MRQKDSRVKVMLTRSLLLTRSRVNPKFLGTVQLSLLSTAEGKERHNPYGVETKDVKKYRVPINIHVAVDVVKDLAWAKFDETVELSLNLGLDPRKPNQSIKGVANLPHGNGKKVRVCVFATGKEAQDALEAGADVVGSDDLMAQIQGGDVAFDTIIATPSLMSTVGKIGRVSGHPQPVIINSIVI